MKNPKISVQLSRVLVVLFSSKPTRPLVIVVVCLNKAIDPHSFNPILRTIRRYYDSGVLREPQTRSKKSGGLLWYRTSVFSFTKYDIMTTRTTYYQVLSASLSTNSVATHAILRETGAGTKSYKVTT